MTNTGPMGLTPAQRELVLEWLRDQRETWANVGDRGMISAVDTLVEQAQDAPDPGWSGG